MARSHGDDDLIAAIYDAIIEPSGWDDVVKRIVEATKSVAGGFYTRRADAADLSALCNCDPFYVDAFVQHYYKISPLIAAAAAIAPGEVRSATPFTQTDSFKASAYCTVGVGLLHTPNEFRLLCVHRSPDAIWLEPKEWHLLETLAPHLKRAAEIHQLLARERTAKESLGAAVAAAGFAVFLLTGDCRVVFANPRAEDLIRGGIGLRYECGRLATTSPALTARLHALARHGSQPEQGEGDIGGTLELCRGENRPLVAHVIPLAANRTATIFGFDRPAAAVFVIDPAAGLGTQIQHFAARFGLTPAETRILAVIIAGNGLLAAAASLKITEGTARTHAKRIFSKTGTGRQTELIRRFFETSLPGSPGGA